MATLLQWYWQWNVGLMLAWLAWQLAQALASVLGVQLDHRGQLQSARRVLTVVSAGTLLLLLVDVAWPVMVAQWKHAVVSEWTVIASLQQSASTARAAIDGGQWWRTVVAGLCLGWGVQTVLLVRRWLQLRQLVQAATPWKRVGNCRLYMHSEVAVPFATAALGGASIVLPAALLGNPQAWQFALRHELQHVRSGDLRWLLALEFVNVLCFWNPAAVLWLREFEALQELACDEALVQRRGVDARAYGLCLLDVAQQQSSPALLGASAMVAWLRWFTNPRSTLRRRIMQLNRTPARRSAWQRLVRGTLLAIGLGSSSLLVIAADSTGAAGPNIVPVTRVNPNYPEAALAQKLVGWVQLRFDITATGSVDNLAVVASCAGAELETCKQGDTMFADVAKTAVAKWQYAPEAHSGVETVLRFQLSE